MSKLIFETEQGDKLEILRGSHIAFRQVGREEAFFEWETIPSIHRDLNLMLDQGEEMFRRAKELLESRFDEAMEHQRAHSKKEDS